MKPETIKAGTKKSYERTTGGLRDLLFDTIVDLREGKLDFKVAQQVAAVSREIVSTLDVEMRAHKHMVDMGHESDVLVLAPPTIKLLSNDDAEPA